MPSQANAKQRSLLDFYGFLDHVFKLASKAGHPVRQEKLAKP